MFDDARLCEIRQFFVDDGVSVAEWARSRGFSLPLVYAVLKGRNQATRGESHRIAVALGLKKPTNRLAAMGLERFPIPNQADIGPGQQPVQEGDR